MGVETCGDCWTVEESVLIFIYYTPVIFTSLASNPSTQNRPILLANVIPSPTIAHLMPYLLFCLIMSGFQHGGRIGCACSSGWKIRVA